MPSLCHCHQIRRGPDRPAQPEGADPPPTAGQSPSFHSALQCRLILEAKSPRRTIHQSFLRRSSGASDADGFVSQGVGVIESEAQRSFLPEQFSSLEITGVPDRPLQES